VPNQHMKHGALVPRSLYRATTCDSHILLMTKFLGVLTQHRSVI